MFEDEHSCSVSEWLCDDRTQLQADEPGPVLQQDLLTQPEPPALQLSRGQIYRWGNVSRIRSDVPEPSDVGLGRSALFLWRICTRFLYRPLRDCLTRWIWLLMTFVVSFRPKWRTGPFVKFFRCSYDFIMQKVYFHPSISWESPFKGTVSRDRF